MRTYQYQSYRKLIDETETGYTLSGFGKDGEVELDGSSLWNGDDDTPIQKEGDIVKISQIDVYRNWIEDEDDEEFNAYEYIEFLVKHDSTWSIYTDNSFETAISILVGFKVEWSEQGSQQNGRSHLECFNFGEKQND